MRHATPGGRRPRGPVQVEIRAVAKVLDRSERLRLAAEGRSQHRRGQPVASRRRR